MCLSTLKTVARVGHGWKIVLTDKGSASWSSEWYDSHNEFGMWISDPKNIMLRSHSWPNKEYQCGFHICSTRKEAQDLLKALKANWTWKDTGKWTICKVDFRHVTARGLQIWSWDIYPHAINTIVARDIFVHQPK